MQLKEKRERFLGELCNLCEAPLDPKSESLLVQLHFDYPDNLGIPVGGFLASLLVGLLAFFFLLPTINVIITDGLSHHELFVVFVGIVVILAVISGLASILSRRRTMEANNYLQGVSEELSSMYNYLDDYLIDIEQKYPPIILSSVTTTKIMHYFVLVQLREALGPLNREIRLLLNHKSLSATRHALDLLRSSLQISPAAGQAYAKSIEVPLYNLPRVVDELTLHLRDLLKQLETRMERIQALDSPNLDL